MNLSDRDGVWWIESGHDGTVGMTTQNLSSSIRESIAARDGPVPMLDADISAIGLLFRRVFSESILSALGRRFLDELLLSYMRAPGACGYVFVDDGRVVGFVLGSENSRRHGHWVLTRCAASLVVWTAWAVIVSPHLVGPLLQYLSSYGRALLQLDLLGRSEPVKEGLPPASLVFLAVAPERRRRGIAATLTNAFLAEMTRRGVAQVKLVVTTTNQPAVNFYLTHNWRIAGRYPAPNGQWTYRMIYNLAD